MREEGAYQVCPAAVDPMHPYFAPGAAARPRNSHQTGGAHARSPAADEYGAATFCRLSSYSREAVKRAMVMQAIDSSAKRILRTFGIE